MGNCLKLQRAASWADGREWEEDEEAVAGVGKRTTAVEKMERVEVKIRVTRRQLQELLETQASCRDGKLRQRQAENVLVELMTSGVVCYQPAPHEATAMRGHWRPSLHSIPEES